MLDRSIAGASAFTRALFETDGWDAATVEGFINQQRNITIATVTSAGDPHAAVVIAACFDQAIHFTVAVESLLNRCIQRHSTISFSVCDAAHAVMGRGTAIKVGRSLDEPELVRQLADATTIGMFTPPAWDGLIFQIALERMFAS